MSTTSTSPTPFPAGKTPISVCCSAPVRYSGHPSRYVCFSCGLLSEIKGDYQPKVGDRVSLEGEIVELAGEGCVKVELSEEMFSVQGFKKVLVSTKGLTLLSRKSPRKVTRKEVEEVLGEPFTLID